MLAPIVIGGIVLLPAPAVAVILGGFLVVGAWEWSGLLGWRRPLARFSYAVLVTLLAIATWRWNESAAVFPDLCLFALLWWSAAFVLVVAAQRRRLGKIIAVASNGTAGLMVLLPAWSAIVWLLNNDRAMLLGFLGLIWVADGAAYFIGRRWGRRRLASNVSPGKSWEGVAAGIGFGAIFAAVISHTVVLSDRARIALIVVAIVSIVISIVGDLFVSMLKRHVGAKDSGSILPGHGGVMDRIDGLVAAAPVFAAGLHQWVNRL